jgi:hypothetical protein
MTGDLAYSASYNTKATAATIPGVSKAQHLGEAAEYCTLTPKREMGISVTAIGFRRIPM